MRRLPKSRARVKITLWLYTRKLCGYLVLFSLVFAFGWLFDKSIETACMMASYLATRFLVPKIKHFNSTQKCISVSTMTFLFGLAILCVPKSVSIIWNVGVGCCIPLIMYAESLLFDPVVSDEDRMVEVCKSHNYTELKTRMAVKFFVEKRTPKEVWEWLCETQENPIEWDSVRQMKWRMKKELFKQ